ncbi:hypothetical protein [Solibacillus sp. FSL K6-1523]|uniref:hypothetical protein n=1 Tax=Solibacillus sp. FSL K6-1523 TaxID=2921471 RepID=UPI0030F5999A
MMQQQDNEYSKRAEKWASKNGFKLGALTEKTVTLQRLSDDHSMQVDKRLLDHIMTDEGY